MLGEMRQNSTLSPSLVFLSTSFLSFLLRISIPPATFEEGVLLWGMASLDEDDEWVSGFAVVKAAGKLAGVCAGSLFSVGTFAESLLSSSIMRCSTARFIPSNDSLCSTVKTTWYS